MAERKCCSPLPELPEVIANAFCNGCVSLPNLDLLIFLYLLKSFLSYHIIDLQLTLMQSHLKGLMLSLNSVLVAMETASIRHYPTVTKT